jgi:hypothetical protein
MRTFLAILKDSYKEAVSGWILQAMLIIAGLFMLAVLSLSYRHLPPEEAISRQYNLLNIVYQKNPDVGNPTFKVQNFVQTKAGPYWRGDYQFDVVLNCPDEASLSKAKGIPGFPTTPATQIRLMRQSVDFKEIAGTVAKNSPPGELRITYVTTDTNVEDALSWPSYPTILFGVELDFMKLSPRSMVYRLEKNIFGDFGVLAGLILSVIVTAGFIPNLLRKGSLDLYVSKPIGRVQLLLMKYFGGLVYVVLLSAFTVFGIWLVIGFKSGVWSPGFLLMIPMLTFYFSLLYAISTLFAVLTRNNLVAILGTSLIWGLVTLVGYGHESVEGINEEAKNQIIEAKKMQGEAGASEDEIKATQPIASIWENVLFGLRRALPRTYDIDKLSGRMIAKSVLSESEYKSRKFDTDLGVSWGEVIIVSLLQISAMLGLASWVMVKRDG